MTRHAYGPHRPEDAPAFVTIGAGPHETTVPVHPDVLRQRAAMNNLAANRQATVTNLATARAARDAGQSLAAAAHPEERARVEAAIRQLAATGQPFSANDARAIHGVKGGVVGATFTALRKEGVIRPCGDETSTSEATHGHRVYRWVGAA